MSNFDDAMIDLRDVSAYSLSNDADVHVGSWDSAGAAFLMRVRDAVLEAVEWEIKHDHSEVSADLIEGLRGDAFTYLDSTVPVYTGEVWATWTDLQLYTEEVEYPSDDLTQVAMGMLLAVAERLTYALLDTLEDAAREDEEEADEDE